MPIYDVYCTNCEWKDENFKTSSDKISSLTCPECNGEVKQVFGSFNFHLKGGGWASVPEGKDIFKQAVYDNRVTEYEKAKKQRMGKHYRPPKKTKNTEAEKRRDALKRAQEKRKSKEN